MSNENASQGKRQTVRGQRKSSATCGSVTLLRMHYFSEPHKTHRAARRSYWAKDGARDSCTEKRERRKLQPWPQRKGVCGARCQSAHLGRAPPQAMEVWC